MMKIRTQLAITLCMGLLVPAHAQFRPRRRYALTAGAVAQAIVKALSQQNIAVAGEQVSLLANVVATEPEPALDVLGVGETLAGGSTVRLACHVAGSCVPFYAMVRWTDGAPSIKGTEVAKGGPVLMSAGTRATMWMGDERTRISMAVVSLERGAAGRTIRVASVDRKRIYTAEVVSADVVRGRY